MLFTREKSLHRLISDFLLNAIAASMRKRAKRLHRSGGIVVPIDDLIGIRMFATGSYEQTSLDGIVDYVAETDIGRDGIFVDVGANIGIYSIVLSELFTRQIAIEANPVTFKILEVNTELSGMKNTQLINVGLSDTCREGTIFVPRSGNLGWATLNAAHVEESAVGLSVPLKTLDSLIGENDIDASRIKLIKIDVEGHEINVLKGASELLRRYKPALLCEVLSHDEGRPLQELLGDFGYRHMSVFERRWSPSAPLSLPGVRRRIDEAGLKRHALVLFEP